VYDTGFHFVLKPLDLERMYKFPKDLQVIDFTGTREEAAREANVTRAAHIQTSDGFYVDVDVSIIYHIKDPYLVFTRLGPDRLFEANGIQPKAEPVLKQTLGELTTEEFYVSPMRHARAEEARDYLNRDLADYGIEVDQVLVRYFRYTDEIQKNIEEKKLKDQLVFKNQAEGRAATEGAKLKKMIQEGQASVDIKLQEGDAYKVTKQAERDLYVRTKHAEGDLLVKLAEARKTQLRNDAMQVSGSDRLVGLKLAEAMQGIELLVLPSDGVDGFNPLDLTRRCASSTSAAPRTPLTRPCRCAHCSPPRSSSSSAPSSSGRTPRARPRSGYASPSGIRSTAAVSCARCIRPARCISSRRCSTTGTPSTPSSRIWR
jgi:regulator of protease activity HflC (stomatin/prohibitin superfamily)